MRYVKIYITSEEKLWLIFISLIFIFSLVYIASLNFAVSQTFRREEIFRELKIMRQDFQKSEEFFIAELSEFYSAYSEDFIASKAAAQEFVSRRDNFAVSPRATLR